MFTVNMSLEGAKEGFLTSAFDLPIENGIKKILNEFGAYCRTVAKNSIKTRPATDHSSPGQVPYGHDGNPRYKDFIFYFYDKGAKEVVIGAILLPRKDQTIVPGVLELGGQVQKTVRINGRLERITYTQDARPHMQLAFDKAVEKKLPGLIENSIIAE